MFYNALQHFYQLFLTIKPQKPVIKKFNRIFTNHLQVLFYD